MLRAHMSLHMIQPTEPLRIMLAPSIRAKNLLRRVHRQMSLQIFGVEEALPAGAAGMLALLFGRVRAHVV